MNLEALEAERQAILSRMETSREHYRRMLMGESNDTTQSRASNGHAAADAAPNTSYYGHNSDGMYGHGQSDAAGLDMNRLQDGAAIAADAAFAWVKQHPVLTAAAVAAIVAIGPRRIMKSLAAGGTALGAAGAVALRNPQNIDLITRLFSTAAAGLQQRTNARSSTHTPP
jgi:hypothetical protein